MDTPRSEIEREARALTLREVRDALCGCPIVVIDREKHPHGDRLGMRRSDAAKALAELESLGEPPQPAPDAEQGQLREALKKCEDAIRRMAARLDKEPGNQTAVALWLHLADEAAAALASRQPGPEPRYEQDEATGLTRMTNFADVLKGQPARRSTPCPFCPQETAHSHLVTFSGHSASAMRAYDSSGDDGPRTS